MRLNKIKPIIVILTIAGIAFNTGYAWAVDLSNPLGRVKENLDQRIYIRNLNEQLFTRSSSFPKYRAQLTPLVPENPGPAYSWARGTHLFLESFPKPKIDKGALDRDKRKMKLYLERKVGREKVRKTIAVANEITEKVKSVKKELAKITEELNRKNLAPALSPKKFSSPQNISRSSGIVRRNLFDPNRKRFLPREKKISPSLKTAGKTF